MGRFKTNEERLRLIHLKKEKRAENDTKTAAFIAAIKKKLVKK